MSGWRRVKVCNEEKNPSLEFLLKAQDLCIDK